MHPACIAVEMTWWHEIWPWFSSRTLCGITGMKGPSLCLSASNSARYLQKDRNIPISHHSSRVVQHASLTNIKFSKNRIAWKSREIPPTYTWKRTVTGSQTQASKHWALVQKNRVKVRREATLTKNRRSQRGESDPVTKGHKPRHRTTPDSNRKKPPMIPRTHKNHPPIMSSRERSEPTRSRKAGGGQVRCLAYFSCSATAAEGDRSPPMRGECGVVDGEGE